MKKKQKKKGEDQAKLVEVMAEAQEGVIPYNEPLSPSPKPSYNNNEQDSDILLLLEDSDAEVCTCFKNLPSETMKTVTQRRRRKKCCVQNLYLQLKVKRNP
ncbi:uncharacterized protein [Penaeus vannamei]|uniref:uncharacterized protein n=1 Tax=Penaeus vannamei TaxID=6689 RepID=UPI00387FA7B5